MTKAKEYEQSGAIPIESLMWPHLCTNQLEYLKARIFGFNKDRFLKIWGRQDFCWTGGSENRRFHVWVFECDNCRLFVLTNSTKGTCYEYVLTGDEDKAREEIIRILEMICGWL